MKLISPSPLFPLHPGLPRWTDERAALQAQVEGLQAQVQLKEAAMAAALESQQSKHKEQVNAMRRSHQTALTATEDRLLWEMRILNKRICSLEYGVSIDHVATGTQTLTFVRLWRHPPFPVRARPPFPPPPPSHPPSRKKC